ncbi:tyrosine-type recombinase/integrase [Polynucleobacter rarus]|uniref:tyrosine-type recombinase/integrase n=1 Tax=Polynucleobacter rarus TaxID=556055 RepID=UPI000D3E3704|nr:tyrosine-type recombinase/integrase [Polynucleobacter rarus]
MTYAKLNQYSALNHTSNPNLIYLRDGEVVVYRRSASPLYQCRYKLADGQWHRQSTRKASIEKAVIVACLLYDEARFRQKLGLAHKAQTFAQIAHGTLIELRAQIDLKRGRGALDSYVTCIEKYFLPYFADKRMEELVHKDIIEFEVWRNRQMNKQPKASTLNNFASAWNRLIKTAIDRGYLSENATIPRLTTQGIKSNPRPAFNRTEIDSLLTYMKTWCVGGRVGIDSEMRLLLRDYIEMLLYTGIRHGTEAMGICWNNIEWHTDKQVRYLRLWVDGKTGGRWLIAKHKAVEVLERLHKRQTDICNIEFEELFKTRVKHKLFRISNNYQPPSLNGTFRRLMRDCGLLKSNEGQTRTLYSLRHTYATFELLENHTDIHTLAKQMGNSAAMIERHYSKLTATMAAERLA